MKSMSPWFQTASLLNGIRKTISNIEASRGDSASFQHRDGGSSKNAMSSKCKDKSDRNAT